MLNGLLAARGLWHGTTRLTLDPDAPPNASPSTAALAPNGDGWRLAYTWAYDGTPHTGDLRIACDADGAATVHWTDSFHTPDGPMACTGTAGDDGAVRVAGTYGAPDGPDWGWRIAVEPVGREALRVVMHNVSPGGEADLAVEADYEPA